MHKMTPNQLSFWKLSLAYNSKGAGQIKVLFNLVSKLERMAGIEPALSAWKAGVIPLYDIRGTC